MCRILVHFALLTVLYTTLCVGESFYTDASTTPVPRRPQTTFYDGGMVGPSGLCRARSLGGPSARDKHLMCSLMALEADGPRVSSLSDEPLDSIASLSLSCNKVFYSQSVLSSRHLTAFPRLRALTVDSCKINELDTTTFVGASGLRNLTVRSYHSEDLGPAMSVTAQVDVFRPLQQLERLDLSTNNIWELPRLAFCHLPNLQWLNLSHNHLQELGQLGWGGSGALETRCVSDSVVTLDIGHNDLGVVGGGALKGLPRLQYLHLQYNSIAKLDDNAFQGLSSLVSLDLSNNELVALPEDAFIHIPSLMYLLARNNSLSVLAPGLFSQLSHLVELDLSHNDLQSEWLTSSIFQGLIRLMRLDLSYNKISHLNAQVFRDLYTVQVLQFSHNNLKTIPAAAFSACTNLHRLDLSFNHLTMISDRTFQGLNVLSHLALDNNSIDEITPNGLNNLTILKDLNLNGNKLTSFPEAIVHLKYLETLDLGENLIRTLNRIPVKGLDKLYGLRLTGNIIKGNISKNTFLDIPNLKVLNLAKNEITHVETGTFETNHNIEAIRLDANKLVNIHGLFEKLPNLKWLNVSDNNIEIFDYHFIPVSLKWLDLHKNKISKLGNYMERHDLNLQTLDASFNKLSYVNQIQIPDSAEIVFLNDNKLSRVEPFTFFKKMNLTRVDLFANDLTKMDMSALRLEPVPADRDLPKFYLGGNPFMCDCNMEWLQRINNLEHLERQHPTIMDLESIYCQLTFARSGAFIPLVEVNPSQFLCQYETHCFALCHCCEYDACDCEMTCPDGCNCYHDQSWHTNIVDCSMQDAMQVPELIPMDSTQAFLDGNELVSLSPYAFIGRKHMQVLFINNSNVQTIDNETFSSLTRLNELHLEDNAIEELVGNEFKGLSVLRELYLHSNKLKYIHQHTFATLFHLEVLTLHNNQLVNFPVWRLVDNPYLVQVNILANHWTCHCQFVQSFNIWMSGNDRKVVNANEIMCYADMRNAEPSDFIVDLNYTSCSNITTTLIHPLLFDGILFPIIAICVPFIVIVLLLIFCFIYHGTIRVCIYSRCGCRLCYRSSPPEDSDKPYDAFVSYSSKDVSWVNQVLAGELERGENPYQLCLHYRDFANTTYIGDSIIDAVNSSRRTIVILSKNFIENEWCRFEFKSVHQEILKKHRNRILVIILGEIPSRDLDPDLRIFLKTSKVIRTNDKFFWEKLKFLLPDASSGYDQEEHIYSSILERSNTCTSNRYSVNSSSKQQHVNTSKYSVSSPPNSMHPSFHQQHSEAYWA
ncbi:unnamed protein product, partial [Meganyctiphanes norvegica]